MQKFMRRLITGHNEQGASIFTEDGQLPLTLASETLPGFELTELFYTEDVPQTLQTALTSRPYELALPPGAFRFCICQIPPLSNLIEYAKQHDISLPADDRDYLLHKTQSIDYLYILQGEVILRLDSGEEKLVKAGDFIVQRGTVHGWNNMTNEACILLCIMIGTHQ